MFFRRSLFFVKSFHKCALCQITDKNYNLVSTVVPKGKAAVTEGDCHMAFSCTPDGDSQPDVIVRFISRGKAEVITS